MKGFQFSLLMLSIAAGSLLVLGDETSSENEIQADASVNCTAEELEDPHTDTRSQFTCLYLLAMLYGTQMKLAATAEQRLFVSKLYCEMKPISQCLDGVKNHMARCHKEAVNGSITALVDTVQSALGAVCRDTGVRAATVYGDYFSLNREERGLMESCMITPPPSTAAIEELLEAAYRLIKSNRACLLEKGTGVMKTINELDSLLGEILSVMKCIDPQDESIVLCSTMPN